MTEPVAYQYRAFISYSHADTAWAKWLHHALESFRIDKDLVGRETPAGTIPKVLRPVFRDREDFTAGHSLTDQTLAALDASAALIVLCSPASANSQYVTEEIRLFKARHPERPLIPLIVGGTPGDADAECFPASLKFALDDEGRITDEPVQLLAADARENGDGKQLALAKVVAGLLGVSSDDIYRRAERERRRKGRIRNSVIAVLALLVVATSGSAVYAWQQLKTNEAFLGAALKRAIDIVNTAVSQAETYGVPRKTTLALLSQAEGLFDDMARLGRPTPELQQRKAWMLIQFARNYSILGDTAKQKARAEEAHRLMAELSTNTPDDLDKLNKLSLALDEKGNVALAQGNLGAALQAYQDSLAIRERLVKADPSNPDWQRDLSVSYDKVGDVLRAQGKLADALAAHKDSLAIAERLAKAYSHVGFAQRDLASSYNSIGNVLVAQGDLAGALKAYQDSLAISERLAEADPSNAGWQHDLTVSYDRIADVFLAQGKLEAALRTYKDSLAIFERLAKLDPDNAEWQRDLAMSNASLGLLLIQSGEPRQALERFRQGRAIMAQLKDQSPDDAQLHKDLAAFDAEIAKLEQAGAVKPEAAQPEQAAR